MIGNRRLRRRGEGSSPEMNLVLYILMWFFAFVLFPSPHCVVEVSVANRNGAVGEGKTRLIFCICAMHLFWRSQAQGRVRPAVVIQVYSLGGGPAGLRFGGKSGIQPILLFE